MKRLGALFVASAPTAALAVPLNAQSNDISGEWELTREGGPGGGGGGGGQRGGRRGGGGGGGGGPTKMVIEQDGDTFTGTLELPFGEAKIQAGTIDGDEIKAHWERWDVGKAEWKAESVEDAIQTIRHVYQDDQATLGHGRALREALGWCWYTKTHVMQETVQAVEKFAPYERVQDEYPEGRSALRELIERCQSGGQALFAFVNNRFEGSAVETIESAI